MPNCAIVSCKARSQDLSITKGGISFHRFPKDPNVKNKWILACGRKNWFPPKFATICSAHFHLTDYTETSKSRRLLSQAAYPTIDVWRSSGRDENHGTTKAQSNKKTKRNDPDSSPSTSDNENVDTPTQSESTTVKRLIEQRSRMLVALKYEKMKVKKFRDQLRRKVKQNAALRNIILELKKKLSKKRKKPDGDTKYI